MSCIRSGESISKIIASMTNGIRFMSSFGADTAILCTGPKSVEYGDDYVTISGQCTSNASRLLNEVALEDASGNPVMNAKFPAVDVQQGWTLYAAVRLRWV